MCFLDGRSPQVADGEGAAGRSAERATPAKCCLGELLFLGRSAGELCLTQSQPYVFIQNEYAEPVDYFPYSLVGQDNRLSPGEQGSSPCRVAKIIGVVKWAGSNQNTKGSNPFTPANNSNIFEQ